MLSRRDFLYLSALGLVSAPHAFGATKKLLAPKRRFLASGNSKKAPLRDYKAMTAESVAGEIRVLELGKSGEPFGIQVPLLPHQIAQSPTEPGLLIANEKWGRMAVAADLITRKIRYELPAPDGFNFFGHSAFFPDGKHFLMSAAKKDSLAGYLLRFESATGKLVDKTPTAGLAPHEIRIDAEKRWVAVANGFQARRDDNHASLKFIDLSSGKVQVGFHTPHASHFARLSERDWVVGSVALGNRAICFHLDTSNGRVTEYQSLLPPGTSHKGEALSPVRVSDEVAAVTFPDENKLLIWNVKKQSIRFHDLGDSGLGLAIVDSDLYLNHAKHGALDRFAAGFVDAEKLSASLSGSLGNGSHMTLLSV